MEVNLSGGQTFPPGTEVGAYNASDFRQSEYPLTGPPRPAAVKKATVAANGSLVFTLDPGDYYACASVGGTYRYVAFSAEIPGGAGGEDLIAIEESLAAIEADLAGKVDSGVVGAANGVASLEAAGKVPVTQLPNAIMEYQGAWNASTNTPKLEDGKGSAGDVYRVTAAAERNLGSGVIDFGVGDYAVYNGVTWEKSDTTDAVASVNGKKGAVVLGTGDIAGVATAAEVAAEKAAREAADAAADGLNEIQIPALVVPAAAKGLFIPEAALAITTKRLYLMRAIMPRTGKLRDLTIYVGATSSGKVIAVAYDTGNAAAGKRTKLFASGEVPVGAANGFQVVADPNISVVRGQQLDIGFVFDNAVVTSGKISTALNSSVSVLPTNFNVAAGGALPKMWGIVELAAFEAPAAIEEASVAASTSLPFVLARVS